MMVEPKAKGQKLFCPYCDEEIASGDFPYCQTCQVRVFYCPRCHQRLERENRVCPHCGADIRAEAMKGD